MKLHDVARLVVKVTGIIIVAGAVNRVPFTLVDFFADFSRMSGWLLAAAAFAPWLISFGIGLALIWCADSIVTRATSDDQAMGSLTSADFRALEEIALTVLGVYIVANGLTYAAIYVSQFLRAYPDRPMSIGNFLGPIVLLAVGAALIFGSRGLIALIRRFRNS